MLQNKCFTLFSCHILVGAKVWVEIVATDLQHPLEFEGMNEKSQNNLKSLKIANWSQVLLWIN